MCELDAIDRDYLRFINPGDFRVLDLTCAKCHREASDVVTRSTMAHTAGEIAVARYRAQATDNPLGNYSAVEVQDPNRDPADECSVENYERFEPTPCCLDPHQRRAGAYRRQPSGPVHGQSLHALPPQRFWGEPL